MSVSLELQLTINDDSLSVPITALECEAYYMDEGVSMPFRLEAFFISAEDYTSDKLVGKSGYFRVCQNNLGRTIGGVVVEFRVLNKVDSNYAYAVVLGPRLALLDRTRQNEVFATDSAYDVKTVIQKTLDGTISSGATVTDRGVTVDFTIHDSIQAGTFPRTNITKYNESDFQFFSRTCEHFGIFYIFKCNVCTDSSGKQNATDTVLVASDNSAFPLSSPATWTFKPATTTVGVPSGATGSETSVTSLENIARPTLQQFNLRDFSESAPFTDLLVRSPTETGIGAIVEYGDNYSTTDDGDKLVAIRAQEEAWQSSVFECESTMASLCAGRTFTLTSHTISSYNTEYIILTARHEAGKRGPLGYSANYPTMPYRNSFTAIKKTQTFRPKRVTPRPVMSGVFNAFVQAAGTSTTNADGTTTNNPPKRAVMDSSGRYRVGLVYNEAANKSSPGQGSAPVRQAQPYAGSMTESVVSGMHFPLVNNTEVLVGYVNGDPDRPIILGAAFNSVNTDPVSSSSPTVNRLRTTGGLLMELNDGTPSTQTSSPPPPTPRYIRLDVPKQVTDAPPPATATSDAPAGSYLRLGTAPTDASNNPSDSSAGSGLTYTTSTVAQTDQGNKNEDDPYGEKASSSKTAKTQSKVTATTVTPSHDGILLFSESNLDIYVKQAGLMRFGAGHTTKTETGDSTHTVDNGQYKLTALNGLTITGGNSSSPADIMIHAYNTVTTKSEGDTYDWIYGQTTKYTQGTSKTYFYGFEFTWKMSLSQTVQLSGVNTLTLGLASTITIGSKADFIMGIKVDFVFGPTLKVAGGPDLKMKTVETKLKAACTYISAGAEANVATISNLVSAIRAGGFAMASENIAASVQNHAVQANAGSMSTTMRILSLFA
ncbi:type VI secretion system tip protein VgrG [Aquabacter sp. CN5-332]|uniref:type VI secretion system Vgr family protein n=1 Tax=Aquabacter sp. CN5-332 TaxID=3156608 RepID=UPI0032B61576